MPVVCDDELNGAAFGTSLAATHDKLENEQ
jgi:hypothetical protein